MTPGFLLSFSVLLQIDELAELKAARTNMLAAE